jgi:hypothetical protein
VLEQHPEGLDIADDPGGANNLLIIAFSVAVIFLIVQNRRRNSRRNSEEIDVSDDEDLDNYILTVAKCPPPESLEAFQDKWTSPGTLVASNRAKRFINLVHFPVARLNIQRIGPTCFIFPRLRFVELDLCPTSLLLNYLLTILTSSSHSTNKTWSHPIPPQKIVQSFSNTRMSCRATVVGSLHPDPRIRSDSPLTRSRTIGLKMCWSLSSFMPVFSTMLTE